ncbi:MAG: tetratricopeptide repeat protein [Candidatus Omnitrophica bacterium]|nr:tetratricopeptide repeat protein [Candidatus Omnitrophota bacterium]
MIRRVVLSIAVTIIAVMLFPFLYAADVPDVGDVVCYDPDTGQRVPCDGGGGGGGGVQRGWLWDELNKKQKEEDIEEQEKYRKADEFNKAGNNFYRNGDYDNAIKFYLKALEVIPNQPEVMKNLEYARKWKKYYADQEAAQAAAERERSEKVAAERQRQEKQQAQERQAAANFRDKTGRILAQGSSVDFDGREGSLEFMGSGQTLFSKPSKATLVDLTGKPPATRPPGVEPEVLPVIPEFQDEMYRLEKEYWELEEQIRQLKGKDNVKRAELINRQTYVRSQMGVLRVKILDRVREDNLKPVDEKLEVRLAIIFSAACAVQGDADCAIQLLKEAQDQNPSDPGLRNALEYVNNYLVDLMQKRTGVDVKYAVLMDAIWRGQGNWGLSIAHLRDEAERHPDDKSIRDALRMAEGMGNSADAGQRAAATQQESLRRTDALVSQANDLLSKNDIAGALRLLAEAVPDDPRVIAMKYWIQGYQAGGAALRSAPRNKQVHDLSVKGLDLLNSGDIEGALRLYRKAYELDPNDLAIRDMANWLEGMLAGRRTAQKRGK